MNTYLYCIFSGEGAVGAVSDVWVGVAVTPACCQRYRGSCVQLLVEAAQVGCTLITDITRREGEGSFHPISGSQFANSTFDSPIV
jgi:hypothetical protein